jgi:hypothetical protein
LKEPPGLQNLKERHGIGQRQVSEASYRKYKKKRTNEYEMSDEMVKQGTVELDVKFGTGTLPYRLPVSMSKYGKLTKFKDTVDVGVHKTLNQQFPCHSGDWKGNETVQFMKQLGYGPDSKDVVSGMASELIETICKFKFCSAPLPSSNQKTCLSKGCISYRSALGTCS